MTGKRTYVRNVLLPGLLLSGLTGIITGALIFFYKWAIEYITDLSAWMYDFVRTSPVFACALFPCLALMGLATGVVMKGCPAVRGGGIPTAEGALRGLLTFRWLRTIIGMLFNSIVGFLAGLPLGNEGPSVLMGTMTGRGVTSLVRSGPAWDRYVMTGGAAAGFAVATGAPVTGVIFALEEVHRRFSPMILMVAISSVVFAFGTADALGYVFSRPIQMFPSISVTSLPLSDVWLGAVAGLAAGIVAVVFVKCYALVHKFITEKLKKIPNPVRLAILFCLAGAVALLLPSAAGSGHGLIEKLFSRECVLSAIGILFAVKFIMIIVAGGTGATGGLFIPVLTVGALTGALIAEASVAAGLNEAYYPAIVALTVTAFLGAIMRAPITALTFFIEALGGLGSVLPAALGVLLGYIVAELAGDTPLYEIALESKLKDVYGGKKSRVVEFSATVEAGAFVIGKTSRDVFWPPSCLILEVVHRPSVTDDSEVGKTRSKMDNDGGKVLRTGDKLRLRVETFDIVDTKKHISALLGSEPKEIKKE